jgi:hypothetical protein
MQIRICGPESGQEDDREEKSIGEKRQFWFERVIGRLCQLMVKIKLRVSIKERYRADSSTEDHKPSDNAR